MGILENPGNIVTQSINGFLAPFNSSAAPEYKGSDFKDFIIEEVSNPTQAITLTGNQMPFQPIELGGSQKLMMEYYPGNSEPATQVLGGREKPIKIRGKFKAKKFPRQAPDGMGDLRLVPSAFMERLDAMRRRGNLIRIALGEIERFGFIEDTSFQVRTLAEVDYEITFQIISLTKPENCKFTDPQLSIPLSENDALIKAASQLEAVRVAKPVDFPGTLYTALNDLISDVASVVSAVTKFVDQTISVAEDAQKLTNRALGVIRNARANISQFKRRVGALDAYANSRPGVAALGTWDEAKRTNQAKYVMTIMQATSRPTPIVTDEMKAAASAGVSSYSTKVKTQQRAEASTNSMSIEQLLARMELQFRKIAQTLPMVRHIVVTGQTLQQISMKYYNDADHWDVIYKHNKLTSTVLTPGRVLEIPKI